MLVRALFLSSLVLFSLELSAQSLVSPDRKAYQAAARIFEAPRRIDALETFIKEYPSSPGVKTARTLILDTAIRNWPDQISRLRSQGRSLIHNAPEKDRHNVALLVATKFFTAERLSKETRHLASEVAKHTVNSQEKAEALTLLGKIALQQRKPRKAYPFLVEAFELDPSIRGLGPLLGDLQLKRKDDRQALQTLAIVKVSGRIMPKTQVQLETAWKSLHNNTLDGLEEMLDETYRTRYPSPIQTVPGQAADTRSSRVVLAEVFTGAACGPCAAADLAFDAALQHYSRSDVAVVMYHAHIPNPDPLTTPSTEPRRKYYNVTGTPSWAIDGKVEGGGGPRSAAPFAWDRIQGAIESALNQETDSRLSLTATSKDTDIRIVLKTTIPSSATLHVLLVEKHKRYSGENGIRFHPMVVRAHQEFSTLPNQVIFNLPSVEASIHQYLDEYEASGHRGDSFQFQQKRWPIDVQNLAVVAFLQNTDDRSVLQAVYDNLR